LIDVYFLTFIFAASIPTGILIGKYLVKAGFPFELKLRYGFWRKKTKEFLKE
jgi:hypothetical protein